MGRFTGKTAVITGSGRRKGLGEAIARRLAELPDGHLMYEARDGGGSRFVLELPAASL